jgi:glycerophosphoryl diester phosphodiesterase
MGTCPENALAGIDAALASGVDAIECDVRATSDGVLVLLHDATLERTTGDSRPLASVTAASLAASVRVRDPFERLDPQPVPTLAEALARVNGRAVLAIEVKEADIERAVARAVREARAAAWCWIWAFDPAVARACRTILREVPVALNVGPATLERLELPYVELAAREGFAAVSLDHRLVDAASVEAAHRRGLAVYTWTVDEPADIERVRDAGVDAICGNFPDRIHAALRFGV